MLGRLAFLSSWKISSSSGKLTCSKVSTCNKIRVLRLHGHMSRGFESDRGPLLGYQGCLLNDVFAFVCYISIERPVWLFILSLAWQVHEPVSLRSEYDRETGHCSEVYAQIAHISSAICMSEQTNSIRVSSQMLSGRSELVVAGCHLALRGI